MNALVQISGQAPTTTSFPAWLWQLAWGLGKPGLTAERLAKEAIARHGKIAVWSWLAAGSSMTKPASFPEMAAHLAKLALHFWTPNMSPEQASQKFQDFFADLEGISEPTLARACQQYRTDPSNSYFPTPGKLLALCAEERSQTLRIRRGIRRMEELIEEEDDVPAAPRDFKSLLNNLGHKSLQEAPPMAYRETPPEIAKARKEALERRLNALSQD